MAKSDFLHITFDDNGCAKIKLNSWDESRITAHMPGWRIGFLLNACYCSLLLYFSLLDKRNVLQ